MKKEISILGCGWLGMPLAINLIQKGFIIKGSSTSANKIEMLKFENVVPFLINIANLENNISTFLNSEILIIDIPTKNIDGFKNLISKIENSNVKKVLFVSSTSVYDNSTQLITEETPTNNSILKNIEQLFIANNKFESTIIRFGGLIGYNRKPGNFIPLNKKMENPEAHVNLIHRDDCIRIISQIIIKDIWNQTFNACIDSHPTKRDFYTKEAIKIGREAPVFNEDSSNEYKVIDNSKLKLLLDFSFEYSDLMNY